MLYESYQRKIQKIAAVKKLIKRHRVLIITAAAVIFAMLAGFLSVKGVIYSDNVMPSQITYGEDMPYRANALFGRVSYEYADKDSDEWTSVRPVRAGEYRVRAVAARIFWGTSYGKAQEYQILPKTVDVTVSQETVMYGENPALSADLEFGDGISCYSFSYSDFSNGKARITADKDAVRITDKDGNDVTESYIINPSVSGVTLIKRPVTVTVSDATAVYDGTPLSFSGCEVSSGSLAYGDTLVAVFDKGRIDAGTEENTAKLLVAGKDGTDVTAYYDIHKINGRLTVEKRPVYIRTQSAEKIYDAMPLSFPDYSLSPDTPLVSGHRLTLVNAASLTDAGECGNLLTFRITDGEVDVTQNYSFLFPQQSVLKVRPATLKIRTDGASKMYDSSPLTEGGYSVISQAQPLSGHILTVYFSGAQTRAGSSGNTVESVLITDGSRDVTSNYSFEYEYGLLSVSPRPITVRTSTTALVYNGRAQTSGGFNIIAGQGLGGGDTARAAENTLTSRTEKGSAENRFAVEITDGAGNNVSDSYAISYEYGTLTVNPCAVTVTTGTGELYYSGDESYYDTHTINPGIAQGQISRAKSGTLTKLKDVEKLGEGVYKEYSNEFEIAVFSGENDVTDNYIISYIYGTVKMLPLSVTVTTATAEFVYDGSYQSAGTFNISPSIAAGHSARLKSGTSAVALKDVTRNADNSLIRYSNVLQIEISAEGVDVSGNYNITYSYGMLTMTPRPVTITTDTNTWTYDGQPHSDADLSITSGSLVGGHTAAAAGTLTYITDVIRAPGGAIEGRRNVFAAAIFSGTDDVTHNYVISYEYGMLTVEPRIITVTTSTKSWVYDGIEHYDTGHTVSTGSLASGQTSKVWVVATTITQVIRLSGGVVGSKDNEFEIDILEFYATDIYMDVTDNYNITYIYGTLTVEPRSVVITTNTKSWTYDGLAHYDSGYQKSNTLVGGHQGLVSDITVITNVVRNGSGYTGIENRLAFTVLGAGVDVTYNYAVSYVWGTLTIIPRQITVKPVDRTKPYDGTPLTCSNYEIVSAVKLVEGQFAEAAYGGSQTVIGTGAGTVNLRILSGADDVTYNYDVTKQTGALTVEQRYIVIEAGSASKIYDGKELTSALFGYWGDGLLTGHRLNAVTQGSQTQVGISYNSIIPSSAGVTANGINVSEYYLFSFRNGILQVGLCEITVKTFDKEKEYDGTPLTYGSYSIIGSLLSGDSAYVSVYGSITNVGQATNSASIVLRNSTGKVVTDTYLVTFELGTLTVTGNTGGNINLDGTIDRNSGEGGTGGSGGTGGTGGAGGAGGAEDPVFKATSDTSGKVYFRVKSFGDYTVNGWNNAAPYASGEINALYLMYQALVQSGKKLSNISIEPYYANLFYMLPYYAQNGYRGSLDDTQINVSYTAPYFIDYISYQYKTGDRLAAAGYEEFERAYYNYVQATYLQLPETTRVKLLEIAAKNRLSASSASVINDVAAFVKNAVKYDLDFNEYFGDIAVYFFTQAKTGICQHYATAATAMFRALGIPARYTVGYVGEMTAGKSVDVFGKQAHAWVEVYLPGAGWIQVEVTGAGNGSGAGGGGIGGGGGGSGTGGGGGESVPGTFAIKPVDVYKIYDGTPLSAVNEIEGNDLDSMIFLKLLTDLNYRYTVTVTGSRTEYGVSESNITDFILYDNYGRNVTGELNIVYMPGRIRIIHTPIVINVYSLQKYYDGTPLSYGAQDYWIEPSLPDGMRLEFNLSGTLTDAGILKLSGLEALPYTVYDRYGGNVTGQYSLVFSGEPLRIDKRVLEVTSASAAKTYDGTALTNGTAWISKGFLPQGHRCEITVTGTTTDVGTALNTVGKVTLYDGNNKNVTKNYSVTIVPGTLTVKNN